MGWVKGNGSELRLCRGWSEGAARTEAAVGCSPKADPYVMRVSRAKDGKETFDAEESREATYAGADYQEAS